MENQSIKNVEKTPGKNQMKAWYVLGEHWLSDLHFLSDELQFFRSLIDKYFRAFIEESNFKKTREVTDKLVETGKSRTLLEQKVTQHLKALAHAVEASSSEPANIYKELEQAHAKLEIDIREIVKRFRSVKKEVFQLTEHIMESEKGKHLLGK